MKAISYARISPTKRTDTDEELAKSILTQLKINKVKAEANGDVIVREFVDQYCSGKSQDHMKSFRRMIEFLEINKDDESEEDRVKIIYIRRVNRFGRNVDEMIQTEILLRGWGVRLFFVEQSIDTGTDIGRLIMHQLSHLAEWKRVEILENTERGRRELQEKIDLGLTDKRFGRKRRNVDAKKILSLRPNYSMDEIAEMLNIGVGTLYNRLKEHNKKMGKGV